MGSVPQGVLPEGPGQDHAGLLRLHAVLRHYGLHHREHTPAGCCGGRAGEQRRECLQHGPKYFAVNKPAVCQLDPEGKTSTVGLVCLRLRAEAGREGSSQGDWWAACYSHWELTDPCGQAFPRDSTGSGLGPRPHQHALKASQARSACSRGRATGRGGSEPFPSMGRNVF